MGIYNCLSLTQDNRASCLRYRVSCLNMRQLAPVHLLAAKLVGGNIGM